MKRFLVAVAVSFSCSLLFAQTRVESKFSRDAVGEKSYPSAPRLSMQIAVAPAVALGAATQDASEEIEAIQRWNAEGRVPMKEGFVRSTVDAVAVRVGDRFAAKSGVAISGRGYVASTSRGVVWSGSFKVDHAYRLRLHLEEVSLPPGTVMWVYGNGGEATAFDSSLVDDRGTLWTPSVEGDTVYLEVEVPNAAGTASFIVREVLEIVATALPPKALDSSCVIDATCITTSQLSVIDVLRGAIAHLRYVENGSGFVCTGGLLNDRNSSFTPYLLTANHCFSDQAAASSLEADWDYKRATCNGTVPSRSASPKSNGSTLLATSANSDFTLVRLNAVPAGRWFMGWDPSTTSLTNGMTLYRVSHPFPDDAVTPLPQSYSTSTFSTSGTICSNEPRPRFIYSDFGQGATFGGSSGSPVVYQTAGNSYVVGQLYGTCGPTGVTGCDSRLRNIDGAFSQTYPQIQQFLEGSGGSPAQPAPCVASATTMCLNGDRFAVSATYRTSDQNGTGQSVRLTPDTGYFWFFGASNVEVVVKVIDGCGLSHTFWVFAGGLTDVNVVLTVRDTHTGVTKTYTNPLGTAFQPIQDTSAFSTCGQ